jgi:hypothetical protein
MIQELFKRLQKWYDVARLFRLDSGGWMNKRKIRFPNGNQPQAIIPPAGTRPADLLQALGIQQPNAVILIASGASKMDEQVSLNLSQLCTYGIAPVAASLKALIIDGGTQAGVMAIIGQAVAAQQQRPTLLGIAPVGRVAYPGKATKMLGNEGVSLDPNHSHYILVESNEWGGETETMYDLAKLLSRSCPSVAILMNGGPIAKTEVLHNVRQQRPIIVIEGSGRLADEIARLWKEKPSAISDPQLAEITCQGNLYVFPLTGSAIGLLELTKRLLDG